MNNNNFDYKTEKIINDMFEYRFNYNKSDSDNIEKTKLIVMVSVSNYWNKFIQNLSNFLFNDTDILVIPICAQ